MALIKCKECGQEISSTAAACPKCGAKPPEPPKRTKLITWLIGGFFMIVIVVAISTSLDDTKKADLVEAAKSPAQRAAEASAAARADDVSSAQSLCEDYVVKSLHDPKSAEMNDFRTYAVVEERPKQFKVQVTGRAKNGFNATRQLTVICRVRRDATSWTLMGLQEIK